MPTDVATIRDRPAGEPVAWALALGSVAVATGFAWMGHGAYRIAFGAMNPVLVTVAVCALGLIGLRVLPRDGFPIGVTPDGGFRIAIVLGLALAVPVLVVDALGGFPRDLNVPLPASLLFYPAIAVVAELAFHVLPLSLAAAVARAIPRIRRPAWWMGFTLAALAEAALQVVWGAAHSPAWANAYVGVHLVAFNLVALWFLRRHGFLAAYVFRLAYYLLWHIAWGHARLELLFGGD